MRGFPRINSAIGDQGEFESFANDGAVCGQEQVFHQLLADRRGPSDATSSANLVRQELDLGPVDSLVSVESAVFRCDDRVLEFERNPVEQDKSLPLRVVLAGDKGFDSVLELYRSPEGIHRSQDPQRKCAEGVEGEQQAGCRTDEAARQPPLWTAP